MSKGIMSPPANVRPPHLQNVGIEQHLDAQVPADLTFVDDTGRTVKLGDYFGNKPLILNLVYYNCTMLCGEALAGLSGSMKMVKFNVGNEFDVITVSFNPKETPAIAAAKKQDYLKRYGRPGAASGWHFLTGPAGVDQRAHQGRRLPVSVRSQEQPVRARHRHHGADAARPHLALLLRRGLSAERSAHGIGRSLAGQDRQRRRSGAALLLSLRSRDRKIRRGRSPTFCGWARDSQFCCLGGLLFILFRLDKAATRRRDWSDARRAGHEFTRLHRAEQDGEHRESPAQSRD